MSGNTVVEMTPKVEPKMMIGLIPAFNLFFLNPAWEAIRPGIEELCKNSNGEMEPHKLYMGIHNAQLHLYLIYMDKTGTVTPERFQEAFPEKLRTPKDDYAGFFIVRLQEDAAHVLAAFTEPAYRQTNIIKLAGDWLEEQIKKIPFPYLSLATRKELGTHLPPGWFETTVNYRKKIV